jgi:hypothetical protein
MQEGVLIAGAFDNMKHNLTKVTCTTMKHYFKTEPSMSAQDEISSERETSLLL